MGPVTRRQFLGGGVVSALSAVAIRFDPELHDASRASKIVINNRPEVIIAVKPAEPLVHFSLDRPDDLALVDIYFHGFTLEKGAKHPSLVATAATSSDTWIGVTVQFPPQTIAEADYYLGQTPQTDPSPILSQLSGPSTLAFTFKHGDSIPLPTGNVEDLLDWSGWNLNVPPAAITGSGVAAPSAPKSFQTQIEAPIALILAPVVDGSTSLTKGTFTTFFDTPVSPRTNVANNVTECFSAKLKSNYVERINRVPFITPAVPLISAVWATDYLKGANDATPEEYVFYGKPLT